jgi:hypothetical protein
MNAPEPMSSHHNALLVHRAQSSWQAVLEAAARVTRFHAATLDRKVFDAAEPAAGLTQQRRFADRAAANAVPSAHDRGDSRVTQA